MSGQQVWDLLAKREMYRVSYSAARRPKSSAEMYYAVAGSLQNPEANRYSNVFAYDRTAVQVEGEYLNANVIKDGYGRWWVAAQAPLPNTFDAFFTAIQSKSASRHPLIRAETSGAVIVQLTGYKERGVRKADPYLNLVKIDRQTQRTDISSTVSEFHIGELPVTHYLFSAWPDHGVPEGEAIEALRRLVLEIGDVSKAREIWVHCSAGVGRSGAFIALSSLLLTRGPPEAQHTSPLGPLPPALEGDEVAATVDALRDWRGMLVQTPEQLELVYGLTAGSRS